LDKIIATLIAISGFLNAILMIVNFIKIAKKPVDKVWERKLNEALKPLNDKSDDINKYIKKIDKNECMNFLVNFLADIENGIEKDDVQTKRACEVYDHYVKDLQGNSYIHDKWTRLMIEGGKI
jgi:hypothetical protein